MNDYYFLYKNSLGEWRDAINPVFIAKHQYCRAIPKEVIKKVHCEFVADFISLLNDKDLVKSSELDLIIIEFELY
jgi:hypothetical protein